jgi:lipopolysaccharide biosynthesis protein
MKFIAFYLPQYHPIPENDSWWGKGFTDWANVRNTKPRFKGHYQPHVPGTLGYYDLRDAGIREQQALLAREFELDGFCYYHYWFNGKRLLHEPLDAIISSKKPDFPFCLCWANENWTRTWDGKDREILLEQKYSPEDHAHHAKWLLDVFTDKRYILIDGKPLLLIYRVDTIKYLDLLVANLHKGAIKRGFPGVFLCAVRSNFNQPINSSIISMGVSAFVDFQPNKREMGAETIIARCYRLICRGINQILKISRLIKWIHPLNVSRILSYNKFVERIMHSPMHYDYSVYPCVFPSWDNSARRTMANIIQNDDPQLFGKWLEHAAKMQSGIPQNRRMVFINAWNEWAEGCHLEPDLRCGTGFLSEIKKVKCALAKDESLK